MILWLDHAVAVGVDVTAVRRLPFAVPFGESDALEASPVENICSQQHSTDVSRNTHTQSILAYAAGTLGSPLVAA